MGLLLLLAISLLFIILFGVDKYKRLIIKREFYQNEVNEKKEIREILQKKLLYWLYPAYLILLSSFIGFSYLFSAIFSNGFTLDGISSGALVTEGAIFMIFLFAVNQPHEFKYVVEHTKPFLKRKIFGVYINIDQDIEKAEKKLAMIDKKLKKLNLAFA